MNPASIYPVIPTVPNMINPLLYWTTSDLMTTDPALLSVGIETSICILLRAGIQRTFDNVGYSCDGVLTARPDQVIVSMAYWSRIMLVLTICIQLLWCLVILILGVHWIRIEYPITPGLRAVEDSCFLFSLLSESPFSGSLVNTSNAQRYVIWQKFDFVVRIGEQLDKFDELVGKIRVDRPKLIKELTNGSVYT
jgi:hypothetical protein